MIKQVSKRRLKKREMLEVTHFTIEDIIEYHRINGYDFMENSPILEGKNYD